MALFCIPKQFIDVLTTSALKSEIDLESLYLMDSKSRREFFTKYTDKQVGKFLNAKFEQAMVDKQQDAITKWAESVFTPKEKKAPAFKTVLDKIKQLTDLGYLNEKAEDVFLEDLVSDRLGVNITAEEMENITTKARKVQEAQLAVGLDLGNPEKSAETVAFFVALKEINDYMQSIAPVPVFELLFSSLRKANLLASVKSTVINVTSNALLAGAEMVTRRISNGTVRGANNRLALDYIKLAREVYKKTGYDISRMINIKDTGAGGERYLGDTQHSQGPGRARGYIRFMEDLVFKNLTGAPDAAFASAHFSDSLNLISLKLAEGDSELASEYMRDAMRVSPVSDEGQLLRAQGIMDAMYATATQDTWLSKATLDVRKVLNNIKAPFRFGDFFDPFVKTGSNLIAMGLYDSTGAAGLHGAVEWGNMLRKRSFDPEVARSATKKIVRSGLWITSALLLTGLVDEDDYVGPYDPARYQIDQLRNSPQSAFRIGGHWISTDYLGPLAVPFNAIMHARKYGKAGPGEFMWEYAKGAGGTILNAPVISSLGETWSNMQKKQDMTLPEMVAAGGEGLVNQFGSILVPSMLSDVAKALDDTERKPENALQGLQSKVPGLRNMLPEKTNVFGETMKTENPLYTILFGARVKTDTSDPLIDEIVEVVRLSGKNISFTDWKKSNSKKLAQFRQKVGDKRYNEAIEEYGKNMRKLIRSTTRSVEYRKADVEEKNDILSSLDTKATEEVFKKYNFTYKTEKKKR